MTARRISWDDVQANYSMRGGQKWQDRSGRTKVNVSLKGASFVHKCFWLKDADLTRASLQAWLLLELQRVLASRLRNLRPYLADEKS